MEGVIDELETDFAMHMGGGGHLLSKGYKINSRRGFYVSANP